MLRFEMIIAVYLVTIIGCGGSPTSSESVIIGTWQPTFSRTDSQGNELDALIITFRENGTYLENNNEISTYSISGDRLTFVSKASPGGVATVAFELSNDGQQLTIFSSGSGSIKIAPLAGVYQKM